MCRSCDVKMSAAKTLIKLFFFPSTGARHFPDQICLLLPGHMVPKGLRGNLPLQHTPGPGGSRLHAELHGHPVPGLRNLLARLLLWIPRDHLSGDWDRVSRFSRWLPRFWDRITGLWQRKFPWQRKRDLVRELQRSADRAEKTSTETAHPRTLLQQGKNYTICSYEWVLWIILHACFWGTCHPVASWLCSVAQPPKRTCFFINCGIWTVTLINLVAHERLGLQSFPCFLCCCAARVIVLINHKDAVICAAPCSTSCWKQAESKQPLGFMIIIISEAVNQFLTEWWEKHENRWHRQDNVDFCFFTFWGN